MSNDKKVTNNQQQEKNELKAKSAALFHQYLVKALKITKKQDSAQYVYKKHLL